MNYVGKSVARVDALSKVKGEAVFASDMSMPGQAYMKVLMAHRAHAVVRAVDTSRAEALDGVLLVLTARDVPSNEFGYYSYDQPVLCGPGPKPYTDRVRFVGDRVAAVVAESEEIAARALELIDVEYEDLPVVCDMEAALEPDAPLLHPELGTNQFGHHFLRNGDLQAGFRDADVVVEAVYNTPAQEHAYLQTEAGLAYVDEAGRVAVVTGAGSGIGFGVAVAIGLAYLSIFYAGIGLGYLDKLPPALAAWLANAVFSALGIVLFKRSAT